MSAIQFLRDGHGAEIKQWFISLGYKWTDVLIPDGRPLSKVQWIVKNKNGKMEYIDYGDTIEYDGENFHVVKAAIPEQTK